MGELVKLSSPYRWKTVREYEPSECCGHFVALARAEDGTFAVLIVAGDTFEVVRRFSGTAEGAALAAAAAEIADTTVAMHTFMQPEA